MGDISSCRICGSKNLNKFFDLGSQPLANFLLDSQDQKEDVYPLSLTWCSDCNLVQLTHTVDPRKLFNNYFWVTGTSKAANQFSVVFCQELLKRSQLLPSDYVLEIASNDGTFLRPFINQGYKVLGVDPAKNIITKANESKIPTRCLFWGRAAAGDILKEIGQAKIIFARNVLAHVADLPDFIGGLADCLHQDGTLAIEVHYAKSIFENLQYDSIYHEHLCYFTLKTLENLLNKFGLFIFDVIESPISGGAIVVYFKKKRCLEESNVDKLRAVELESRINNLITWQDFVGSCVAHRQKLLDFISDFKNKRITAWGASARSSTLLNFCNIDYKTISAIADKNPLKQGKFTAGSRIPINDPAVVMQNTPELMVILAWNFADEIISELKNRFNYQGRCLVVLPNEPCFLC